MKKIIFSLVLALGSISTVQAADAAAGKSKAAVCGACHGANGVSATDMYPNIAGQNDAYIVKQLNDFKAGTRKDMMMSPMAVNLSDEDMADLAAYFSGLSRTGEQAATNNDAAAVQTASAAPAEVVEVVTSTPAAAIYAGNVKAGKDKSAICASCHGATGISAIGMYPNLAGQGANYLSKQLADFKSGARKDPVMVGMVAALSPEDMNDLGAYFAVQAPKAGAGETSDIGHKLYLGGDAAKGITACVACHGLNGKGMAQAAFPSIAGQNKDYLKKQLATFRDASRGNDTNGIMRNIAIKLSDADVEALTQYMSSLK